MPVLRENIRETFEIDLSKDDPDYGRYANPAAHAYVASFINREHGVVVSQYDFEDTAYGDWVCLNLTASGDKLRFHSSWKRDGKTAAAIIRKAQVIGTSERIREEKSNIGDMEWVSTYVGTVPFGNNAHGADVAIRVDMYGDEEDDAHFVFQDMRVARSTLESGIPTHRIEATAVHVFTKSQQGYCLRVMSPEGELIYGDEKEERKSELYDFGSTAYNGGDVLRLLRIKNLGNKDAALGYPVVTGEGFTAQISSHRRIAPKMGSQELRVIFNPVRRGLHEATITLPMASQNESASLSFSVKGMGE